MLMPMYYSIQGDVIIDFSPLHFGMKEKDPLEHVPFYSKENPNGKC